MQTVATPTFEEIQKDILSRARKADACSEGYTKAKSAKDVAELLSVIKENISWCINNKMLDAQYLVEMFGEDLLWKHHIYTSGNHEIIVTNSAYLVLLGSSSATVETWGSSSATVETWGSSSATVETRDSSSATVETWGSSSATVETWGSSSATVKTWDSSSATVKTWGSSSATVETRDSSKLTHSLGEGACPTIKHLNEMKLYVRTTKFEIITL